MKINSFIWLEEIVEKLEVTHEDAMEAVEIEIDPSSSTVCVPVAKDLVSRMRAQARRQDVSLETPVNLWLQERLASVT